MVGFKTGQLVRNNRTGSVVCVAEWPLVVRLRVGRRGNPNNVGERYRFDVAKGLHNLTLIGNNYKAKG